MLLSTELSKEKIETQNKALNACDFKKAIAIQEEKIADGSEDQKAVYTKDLAMLYLKDQDQERAFATFLKALDITKTSSLIPSYDELEYKKAFSLYIDPNSESPQATAKKLINALTPIVKEKPDQYLLEYFLAIAYANLRKYEEFFSCFYTSYQYYPDHYLAYKTKAILHIKLLERTRGDAERAAQRQAIMDHLLLALQREPKDTTLYKLLISFSPKEKKSEQVLRCLNKIIDNNIMIPRGELMFYVIEAVDMNNPILAQRFISRSKEWYPESRMVSNAQNYLDAHK